MVCGQMVSSDYMLSGVNNRNHCPYCLHSKHVDLHQSGDRLNACRSTMRPIGLAWKKSAQKYGSSRGELMIIHRCDGCHQISINRIAADDRSDLIQRLFQETIHLSSEGLQQLRHNGIQPVTAAHESEILASL
ncbi:MAG: RNHCP domain-containing protein [Anaerolineaceae bacterium]|nr:RNHCP domain-containing protein [Anaerolineaceae bacterium]